MQLAKNKKALFEYEVLKKYIAGMALQGWEVKSIKQGNISLAESFVSIKKGEAWLVSAHVAKWANAEKTLQPQDEIRPRKLLLQKQELNKLMEGRSIKGQTIIPLAVFTDKGKLKLEIALARGKKLYDKRKQIKERDEKRQVANYMKNQDKIW